jgi:hypothetical protein
MAETGNPASPRVQRGAIVQLVEEIGIVVPNVVPFQYNPAKLTLTLTPWNPFEVDQTQRGAQAPMVQPYDPEESYQLELELDATDELEDGDPVAGLSGVAWRIAQLRKLTEPTAGPFGDLIAGAGALLGGGLDTQASRPTVPIALLILGPGLILPVRVTAISIEVTEMSTTLHPHMAKVTLDLRVLTPEAFKCKGGPAVDLAVAAYRLTRLQENALAVAGFAKGIGAVRSILPF